MKSPSCVLTLFLLSLSATAEAQPVPVWTPDMASEEAPPKPPLSSREPGVQMPRLGLTESPFGLAPSTGFLALSGVGTSAKSDNKSEGGVRVGFSPLPRLTVHGYAGRDAKGEFAPSVAAHVRVLGSMEQGAALGLLGQYKAEGFSELGGEVEFGVTGGVRAGRWVLMGNAVVGAGVEEKEEGELDGELKLRAGYDVGAGVRLGAEGQARRRFAGPNKLAGGRDWDALGGPQVSWQGAPMLVAMSFGPSTAGVAQGVGLYTMLTVAAPLGR